MKKTKHQKQFILFLLVIASFLLILPSASSYLYQARIIQSGGSALDLQYDTASNAYTDNVAGLNADAALRIYGTQSADVANKYVGAVYAVGENTGNLQYVIITTGGGSKPLVQTGSSTGCGAGCYYADTSFNVQFASIIVQGGSGNAGAAFYPAHPYLVVSSDDVVDGSDTFISLNPSSDGELVGSYTLNDVQASYDQTTGNANVDITAITPSSSYSDHPSNSFLMVGICNDTYGINCSDTTTTAPNSGAVTLDTAIATPADSLTFTQYAVVNGVGSSFCIGPDLDITAVSPSPSVGPPGTSVILNATVTNQNTVDVTQTFTVDFYYDSIDAGHHIATTTINTGLNDGATTYTWTTWDTTGISNGAHTIYARLNDTGIGDCNDGNDHASSSFTTELVYLPYIWIDGILTDNFSDSGRPYNVTIQINDSNGNPSANTTIKVTEVNGISLLAPLQTFTVNGIKRGVSPISTASVITDNDGFVRFTLVPTGNKLYEPEYSYTDVDSHVGSYSLYFEIFDDSNNELQLYHNSQKIDEYNLTLLDLTARSPNSTEQYTLNTINQDTYVKTFLNFFYQIHATVRKWYTT